MSETSDARRVGNQRIDELVCGELCMWYALSSCKLMPTNHLTGKRSYAKINAPKRCRTIELQDLVVSRNRYTRSSRALTFAALDLSII